MKTTSTLAIAQLR